MTTRRLLLPLALLSALGCGGSSEADTWSALDPQTAGAGTQLQIARAEAAVAQLAAQLTSTLAAELAEGGPPTAISVCREAAPRLAVEVGDEHDVRIGRTSAKLRNPANAVPTWAAEVVAAGDSEPRTFLHGDGTVALLKPIRLSQACLVCHGAVDQLDESVRVALAEDYPHDRATGFAAGDLRGYFWVEAPTP